MERKKNFDPSLPSAWDDKQVIEQIERMMGDALSRVSAVRDNAHTSKFNQKEGAPSQSQHQEREPEAELSSSSSSERTSRRRYTSALSKSK